MANLPCLLFSFALVSCAIAYTYHYGSCPKVEPMPNFDMEKFLGQWFVIYETSTTSTCWTYSYTTNAVKNGQYVLEELGENWIRGKTRNSKDIFIMDSKTPALMTVQLPINNGSQIVFMTDYTKYAGIFTCQNVAFAHRLSASILSRTRTLKKKYVENVVKNITSYGIDKNDLKKISHSNCVKRRSYLWN